MNFNFDKADRIIDATDRDETEYFAGRESEIAAFWAAVLDARQGREATVFRIYQGAPGAGKTALMRRLRDSHARGNFFVTLELDHLDTFEDLVGRIDDALADRDGWNATRLAGTAAQAVEKFTSKNFANTLSEGLKRHLRKSLSESETLVMVLDEAQQLEPGHKRVLNQLHKSGVGIPSVLILAGLSRTEQVVSDLGISRTAHNAPVEMGALAPEECAASTRMMLDELRVGVHPNREQLCEQSHALSFGWPQHLFTVQHAICVELKRVDGYMARVELPRVRAASDAHRAEYYKRRIESDETMAGEAELVQRMIVAVNEKKPRRRSHVNAICDDVLASDDLVVDTTGREFAGAMIDKGVLCHTANGTFESPIPLMVAWAEDSITRLDRGRESQRH